ncbi:MAG: hypothetical protein LIP01_10675 [Tannerellaceae bacterium]|nr:hypothetical protein [Tannerellaceae bacterium]
MARKVMRSLWDISSDVRTEALSTKPVGLVDDYTYGDIGELRENMIDGIPDGSEAELITDENQNGIPDDMEHTTIKEDDYIGIDPDIDPDSENCGC